MTAAFRHGSVECGSCGPDAGQTDDFLDRPDVISHRWRDADFTVALRVEYMDLGMLVGDEGRTARMARLQERLFATTAQRAALLSEAQELAANIGQVRETLGNPFFYRGGNYGRPENADESVANFTGYRSHEPALRLFRRLKATERKLNTLREQLRQMGGGGE